LLYKRTTGKFILVFIYFNFFLKFVHDSAWWQAQVSRIPLPCEGLIAQWFDSTLHAFYWSSKTAPILQIK